MSARLRDWIRFQVLTPDQPHLDLSRWLIALSGSAVVRPRTDPAGMSFLLKRWRTWLSPAARQGRKLHRQRVEMLQRVVELSRETRGA